MFKVSWTGIPSVDEFKKEREMYKKKIKGLGWIATRFSWSLLKVKTQGLS